MAGPCPTLRLRHRLAPEPRPALERRRGAWLRWSVTLPLLLVAWTTGAPATAQDAEAAPHPTGIVEATTQSVERGSYAAEPAVEVEVDGVLSEAVWQRAEVIPLPYEAFPGSNSPAPVATECRLAYDARALYLGCEARDGDVSAIRAYVSDRDELDGQDAIVLGLSPFEDARRAFVFGVNPFGVQEDAFYHEERGTDGSWDAIWSSAGRLVEGGYVIELAVPFRSLRFPDRAGEQSWSFYLERRWPRGAEVRIQSFYEDQDDACRLCQVNRLTGLVGISPGRNVQLIPTVSASRSDARPGAMGVWSEGEPEAEAGLDLAWGVTSDVTLNLTLNPDFSQVEADAAQLDGNRRFALFYPELRPFFQEGADLFSTPLQLAFTRTIADPEAGGKVTGKVAGHAFGALIARDAVTSVLLPGPYGSSSAFLDRGAWAGIATYRRDLGSTAAVGGLVTLREGSGYHNRVASADASFRPHPALRVEVQATASDTEYPDAPDFEGQPTGRFTDRGLYARALLDNRRWVGQAGFSDLGPGYRADAGFLPSVGRRQMWGWLSRRWNGTSSSRLSELSVAAGAWNARATGDALITRGGWASAMVQGPWQSRLYANPNFYQERVGDRTIDYLLTWVGASARPTRWLGLELDGRFGGGVDYANERPARQVQVEPAISLRPGRRLQARLSHGWQRLDDSEGDRIFDAHVSRARLVYSFSARAFVRVVVQYRRTDRDPALYADPVEPRAESALSQLLFSYKVDPQTVVYLGYSDDRVGAADGSDRWLVPTGRTFFLKVGYAFRP
jgi:hypothetical protein